MQLDLTLRVIFILMTSSSIYEITSATIKYDTSQNGWIAFWILLAFFITIFFMWIMTYIIMHNIIKRMEINIKNLSSRLNDDRDKSFLNIDRANGVIELDGSVQIRKPKGACTVCNLPFNAGVDTFRCKCKTYIHLHCLHDLTFCPKCGVEISDIGDLIHGVVHLKKGYDME